MARASDGGEEPPMDDRIAALERDLHEARATFDPPDDGERDERALDCLREGFAPTLRLYVGSRSWGERLDSAHRERLATVANGWLELYCRCYGVDLAPEYPLRSMAETFVDTHDLRDVARVLTHVPDRHED